MQFKVDENLPVEIADILICAGCVADTVLQEGMGGIDDPVIADTCREEDRVLVTLDMDFADIRRCPPELFPGTIVMRLDSQDKAKVIGRLPKLYPLFGA